MACNCRDMPSALSRFPRFFIGFGIAAFGLGADFFSATAFGGFYGKYRPAATGAGFCNGLVPDRVITFGVGRAGVEYLSPSGLALHDGTLVALGAGDACIFWLFQGFDVTALGIAGTTDELAITTALEYQRGAAFRTITSHFLWCFCLCLVSVQIACIVAIRIIGAAEELAMPAQSD